MANNRQNRAPINIINKEKCKYIPFDYNPQLQKPIEKLIDKKEVKIAWGNKNKLISCYQNRRFPHADKNRKNCVYLIPCSCGDFYIGETRRPLKIRITEHKNYVKNKQDTSHIVQHLKNNPNHEIYWENSIIIYEEVVHNERKNIEAMFITANKCHCFSEITHNIDKEFRWVIEKFKKSKKFKNITFFYLE